LRQLQFRTSWIQEKWKAIFSLLNL
jgi:hypothetical protein